MSALQNHFYTPEQYLEMDRSAERRSEYVSGEIIAMAGASREHNLIVTNLVRDISVTLRRSPCETYSNDMRVKGHDTKAYFFPDIVVGCAPLEFEDNSVDILLNPVVIMEVLSPTTELGDKTWKFTHYRRLPTLKDYVMLSQYQPFIEHYTRQANGQWVLTDLQGLDAVLSLPSIGCELPLSEIYERVEFAPDLVLTGENVL